MSVPDLRQALRSPDVRVLSTDIFDTVLLRDTSTETRRLEMASHRAAASLGLDPVAVTRLRWDVQSAAYRSVAVERPTGDASLTAMCTTLAAMLGLDADGMAVLRSAEVSTDIEHLRPHLAVVNMLQDATSRGIRVIAVSDTFYSAADLAAMITTVVGHLPVAAVYSSADLGTTKHAGGIFDHILRIEGVCAENVLHIGDSSHADVEMARRNGWSAVHLPRSRAYRVSKRWGHVRSLPAHLRRSR